LTQEALLAAVEQWPLAGVPEKPGAWLMATARRRAVDHLRRRRMLERKNEMITRGMEAEQQAMPDLDSALDDDIGDELLRLIFTACHPRRLPRDARAALALRMICGLTTEEIARAFLLPNGTIAQRIVRAKRTLSESGLTYETPRGEELSARLSSVLEVVYLIFNEGYTAAGEEWQRPQLCNEALRLGRVLTCIAPHESEAYGLMALMELNASRMSACTDAAGEPILMLDQNRALWDQFQIRRGGPAPALGS
jgi:RNA polymerase sigma factor (sigma-70 family)